MPEYWRRGKAKVSRTKQPQVTLPVFALEGGQLPSGAPCEARRKAVDAPEAPDHSGPRVRQRPFRSISSPWRRGSPWRGPPMRHRRPRPPPRDARSGAGGEPAARAGPPGGYPTQAAPLPAPGEHSEPLQAGGRQASDDLVRPVKSAGGPPPDPACDWAEPPLSFEDLLSRNTGWPQTPERWREQRRRRQLLEADTARIADALEARAFASASMAATSWRLATSPEWRPGRTLPGDRFLPVIAQRDRRPMLNALRYYQRHNPFGLYLRLVVATSGQRVPSAATSGAGWGDAPRCSRFAHEARKRFGVEVVYRATEFTVDEALGFHVHANLLLAPRECCRRIAAGTSSAGCIASLAHTSTMPAGW